MLIPFVLASSDAVYISVVRNIDKETKQRLKRYVQIKGTPKPLMWIVSRRISLLERLERKRFDPFFAVGIGKILGSSPLTTQVLFAFNGNPDRRAQPSRWLYNP